MVEKKRYYTGNSWHSLISTPVVECAP